MSFSLTLHVTEGKIVPERGSALPRVTQQSCVSGLLATGDWAPGLFLCPCWRKLMEKGGESPGRQPSHSEEPRCSGPFSHLVPYSQLRSICPWRAPPEAESGSSGTCFQKNGPQTNCKTQGFSSIFPGHFLAGYLWVGHASPWACFLPEANGDDGYKML